MNREKVFAFAQVGVGLALAAYFIARGGQLGLYAGGLGLALIASAGIMYGRINLFGREDR